MPLTIGLVMLLAWNLYLALQNKTTIEFHEGVTANIKVYLQKKPHWNAFQLSAGFLPQPVRAPDH